MGQGRGSPEYEGDSLMGLLDILERFDQRVDPFADDAPRTAPEAHEMARRLFMERGGQDFRRRQADQLDPRYGREMKMQRYLGNQDRIDAFRPPFTMRLYEGQNAFGAMPYREVERVYPFELPRDWEI